MKRWLKNNSLGLILMLLFFAFLLGQSITGYMQYNENRRLHYSEQIGYTSYLTSGHFIEATFENWESEFLQMAAYVVLTIFLVQKGSAESHKIRNRKTAAVQENGKLTPHSPWPVRRGGLWLKIYENSLSIAFVVLFLMSFWLHAYGGAKEACLDNIEHYQPCLSTTQYVTTSKFWFESFQNWQSEFLAVGSLVLLTIFLRQKGSSQSKPVNFPNFHTGET